VKVHPARGLGVFAVLAMGSCHLLPVESFHSGEIALERGDLVGALRSFDGVSASDPRYAEARLAAAAVERRLRRHMELLLLGLQLRSEWRDDEALAAFAEARSIWHDSPDAELLLRATEARRRCTASLTGPVATVAEAESPRTSTLETANAAEPAAPPAAPTVEMAPPADTEAPSAELARIEARLANGEVEAAVADLLALHRSHPADARVAMRTSRLLQQRGLMRYGQGEVAGALADWQRAFELDPALRSAHVLFDLATAELASPKR